MRRAKNQFFGHFVWATWDRLPLLDSAEVRERVYAEIKAKRDELKCTVHAIGGIEDHVHLVVELAGPVSQAMLAKEVKGASSHLMTHVIAPERFFKWQGGYGSFSLSPRDLPRVIRYVQTQEQHHKGGTTAEFLEPPHISEPEDK